ncbi:hypothetical protein QJQ45_027841, partial [Haematococcus lacustris]
MQNCCKPGPRSSHSEFEAENIPAGSSWHKVHILRFRISTTSCRWRSCNIHRGRYAPVKGSDKATVVLTTVESYPAI